MKHNFTFDLAASPAAALMAIGRFAGGIARFDEYGRHRRNWRWAIASTSIANGDAGSRKSRSLYAALHQRFEHDLPFGRQHGVEPAAPAVALALHPLPIAERVACHARIVQREAGGKVHP